jgi:hypothetical protein
MSSRALQLVCRMAGECTDNECHRMSVSDFRGREYRNLFHKNSLRVSWRPDDDTVKCETESRRQASPLELEILRGSMIPEDTDVMVVFIDE